MEELDYRDYTMEQVIEHLPALLYDIVSGNTEYHPKEALEKYATEWEVVDETDMRFYFPLRGGGAKRITIALTKVETLSEEEY